MQFVIIDIEQLHTRLVNSTGNHEVKLDAWLEANGFRSSDAGFIASNESISTLSCSEIISAEALDAAASYR